MTSQHVKNKSGVTVVLYTLAVTSYILWSITVHTRENVIYSFHTIKIKNDFMGASKKKKQVC